MNLNGRSTSQQASKANRICSSGTLPLLFLCLLILPLSGCSFTPSGSAPAVESTPVPDNVASEAKKIINQFVAHVDKKDYEQTRQMMTPALRAKTPATFQAWIDQGQYQSLSGSQNWQIREVQYTLKGKKMVARTDYTSSDGGKYFTNFIFAKDGDTWLIDKVLPPTKPTKPAGASGQSASSPGK